MGLPGERGGVSVGRFLIVVPPIVGHLYPTLAVGRELMGRGHDVTWVGHTQYLEGHVPEWAPFVSLADKVDDEVIEKITPKNNRSIGGAAAFVTVWRDFVVPIAHQMMPPLLDAIDRLEPDVLIVDQQALAGGIAAELRGIPWATSATTAVELISYAAERLPEESRSAVDPATLTYLFKVRDWLHDLLHALVLDLGISAERAETFDPRFSPTQVVAYTIKELLGFDAEMPGHFTFVGPAIGERPPTMPFPWDWLDGTKPLVLISLGTINYRSGARFFRAAADAVATMDIQAVMIAPEGVDFDPPPNVLVREKVPQLDLLDRVDAVVTHGGQGTVSETFSVGRPMVVAPIRDDQPIIAGQVERAGAGITVRYGRVTSEQLREAIDSVVHDKRYRTAAERIQAAYASAGGRSLAADKFEALLDLPRRSDPGTP
jgi:MGT family glycosyltransferase